MYNISTMNDSELKRRAWHPDNAHDCLNQHLLKTEYHGRKARESGSVLWAYHEMAKGFNWVLYKIGM